MRPISRYPSTASVYCIKNSSSPSSLSNRPLCSIWTVKLPLFPPRKQGFRLKLDQSLSVHSWTDENPHEKSWLLFQTNHSADWMHRFRNPLRMWIWMLPLQRIAAHPRTRADNTQIAATVTAVFCIWFKRPNMAMLQNPSRQQSNGVAWAKDEQYSPRRTGNRSE